MGVSSSCQIFEKLSTALQWVMLNKLEAGGMSHMLDDFFFIGPPQSDKCKNDLMNFLALCGINIPINEKKTFWPVTCITIYGIEVDSIDMMSRLPPDKLDKCRTLVYQFSRRKKVTLQELQFCLFGSSSW